MIIPTPVKLPNVQVASGYPTGGGGGEVTVPPNACGNPGINANGKRLLIAV
jgi:hypothetical protein